MFRLMCWWASGTLGSWLTSWLPPLGSWRSWPRDWAARQYHPLQPAPSPCLVPSVFSEPSICLRLWPLPEVPLFPVQPSPPGSGGCPLSLDSAPGRIISFCAGLPLVSKYTGPSRALGGEAPINYCGSLSPSLAADSLDALLAQLSLPPRGAGAGPEGL